MLYTSQYSLVVVMFVLFSQHDIGEDYSDDDSETTYVFECDFPECNSVCKADVYSILLALKLISNMFIFKEPSNDVSTTDVIHMCLILILFLQKFISRQALNGHIRVHGGR